MFLYLQSPEWCYMYNSTNKEIEEKNIASQNSL